MGKATRWLRNILGMKKDAEKAKTCKETGSGSGGRRGRDDENNDTIWSFAKSKRDTSSSSSTTMTTSLPPLSRIPASEASWLREYIAQTEEQQSKHAIAVATATAAAADAAVAAAQAAVAVVRLTKQGRGGGGIERWAAAKIQAAFRGYLARKALRALKGLVKLQAHVRGYLVRKQAAETLHGMQALHRAQAAVRSLRARRSVCRHTGHHHHANSKLPYRDYKMEGERSYGDQLRNNSGNRLSAASYDHSPYKLRGSYWYDHEESSKVVMGSINDRAARMRSRSRRSNPAASSWSDHGGVEDHHLHHHLYYRPAGSAASSSPLRWPIPARVSNIPERRMNAEEREWGFHYGDSESLMTFTAQSTPRFLNAVLRGKGGSVTPPKSTTVCGDTTTTAYSNMMMPNYLCNTQSFQAKSRAQSAPKQRPEAILTGARERERMPLREIMAERNIRSSEVVGCRGGTGHGH